MNFQSSHPPPPPLPLPLLASVLQPTARMPFAVSCCCDELVLLVFAANISDKIRNQREVAILNNQFPVTYYPFISSVD